MLVRPVLAAIIGALVGIAYEALQAGIAQIVWLQFIFERTLKNLPPETVHALSPMSIGSMAAVAAWIYISGRVIGMMRDGTEHVQHTINAAAGPVRVKPDGIITKGGETAAAITRLAYDSLYPEARLQDPGETDIRRPLP